MSNQEYSELTIQLTRQLPKTVKKAQGIFITPQSIIRLFVSRVNEFIQSTNLTVQNILEPSCGTCEFIHHLANIYRDSHICGIELNPIIFENIIKIGFNPNHVSLINGNFMNHAVDGSRSLQERRYDLIIGNPPFVVIKKDDVPPQYQEYAVGRPNIFGLFIVHALTLLNENGILAFIVPKSFLNSAYYSKIRELIKTTCQILDIIDYKHLNLFIDTEQDTFGLIVQKKVSSEPCSYSYLVNQSYIFTNDSAKLRRLFEGSTTLQKMGLFVKTGSIVWNEHKSLLCDDSKQTLLLYNSNITNKNTVEIKTFKNDEKKQYINLDSVKYEPASGCCIVVNRGNGNSAYKLNYALIELDTNYIAENHLNVIDFVDKDISNEKKKEVFHKIVSSFKNPRTQEFIELFLGNNGLSKTELETVFPIYL
jgi:adenine-specific DNA-methyltransferase